MYWIKQILRILIGILLILIGALTAWNVEFGHVTLCMIGAIGYGVGLLWRDEYRSGQISSFFFSWILFYTVYTATTFLAIGRFTGGLDISVSGNVAEDFAWIYHTIINFLLLFLFWVDREDLESMISGFWSAMVISPIMFVLPFFGRDIWNFEIQYIPYYFLGGVVLGLLDFILKRFDRFYDPFLLFFRKVVIWSLWVFIVITVIPFLLLPFIRV